MLPDPYVPDLGYGTRNRYVGFTVEDPQPQAVRVTMSSLDPPHDICDGQQKWVGQPRKVDELSGETGPGDPGLWVAALVDTPDEAYVTDWTQYDAVYAYDDQVVPNSYYDVQAIGEDCGVMHEGNYMAPLLVVTSEYGNTLGTYDEDACVTNGEGYMDCWTSVAAAIDFDDISSTVAKFQNIPGAPAKARSDVCPCLVDQIVDFTDIPCVVDGFRGLQPDCPPPLKCQ